MHNTHAAIAMPTICTAGAETAKADKGILLVTIMKAHRLAPALKDSMKPTAVARRVASTIQASRSASKMSSGGSTAGAGAGGGAAAAAVDKEPAATGPVAAAVAAAAPDNVAPVLQAAPPVVEGGDGKPKKNPWRKVCAVCDLILQSSRGQHWVVSSSRGCRGEAGSGEPAAAVCAICL